MRAPGSAGAAFTPRRAGRWPRDCRATLAMTEPCHCEEPPGRRLAPPEDRLRDEAISGHQAPTAGAKGYSAPAIHDFLLPGSPTNWGRESHETVLRGHLAHKVALADLDAETAKDVVRRSRMKIKIR